MIKTDHELYIIKIIMSLTTAILLLFLCIFHLITYMALDWRIELNLSKIVQLLVEFAICAVHPIPGNYHFKWTFYKIGGQPVTRLYRVDIILSLIMILRSYLFIRSFLIHLKIFHGKFLIIGRLNAVDFDIYFKIKTLIRFYPGRIMLFSNGIFIFMAGWYLRLTERYYTICNIYILNLFHT